MTADKGYRILFISIVWLFGLACIAGYGIIGATMDNPTFRAVFTLVFGSVMTVATLVFLTVVFSSGGRRHDPLPPLGRRRLRTYGHPTALRKNWLHRN